MLQYIGADDHAVRVGWKLRILDRRALYGSIERASFLGRPGVGLDGVDDQALAGEELRELAAGGANVEDRTRAKRSHVTCDALVATSRIEMKLVRHGCC